MYRLVSILVLAVVLLGGCREKLKCKKLCDRFGGECRHEVIRYVYAVPKHLTVELMRIWNVSGARNGCKQACKGLCPNQERSKVRAANRCIDMKSCRDFALCVREQMRKEGTLAENQALVDRILFLKFGYKRLKNKTVRGASDKKDASKKKKGR